MQNDMQQAVKKRRDIQKRTLKGAATFQKINAI
jgi:hypothetical protein